MSPVQNSLSTDCEPIPGGIGDQLGLDLDLVSPIEEDFGFSVIRAAGFLHRKRGVSPSAIFQVLMTPLVSSFLCNPNLFFTPKWL